MATTRQDLREWFDRGKTKKDVTHMIVAVDKFDWDDYPVYVTKDQDVRDVVKKYDNDAQMSGVMEVYSYNKSFELQVGQTRSFNYD